MKKNLPAILLRSTPFLPYATLKLEVDNEESRNIIDTAAFFHNNFILVGTKQENELPYIGIISKIERKEALPNGNHKIVIKGIERARITNYLTKQSEILETLIEKIENPSIEKEEEIMQNFKERVKYFTSITPTISNDVIEPIKHAKTLSQMVDITANKIIKEMNIKNKILLEFDAVKRMKVVEKYMEEFIKKLPPSFIESYKKVAQIKRQEKEEKKKKETNYPNNIEKRLEIEKQKLKELPIPSIEANICQNYIEVLSKIPFGIYSEDNLELIKVKEKLDQTHFALESVKKRIVEFLAVKQKNPNIKSPILCLVGPPGVGKTTLAFSIAKALNRKFVKMSVGGVSDESEFIGHRRSYIGARPGKIITSLEKAKTMNPVFLIDEIDKIVQNGQGDPKSTLLEILDPVQNRYFVDHYIEEEIDLSSVLFITTANKEEDIKEELKDRLEIIYIKEYSLEEKRVIAENYLIPYLLKEYKLEEETVIFEKDALISIIDTYTKEAGIRDLERKLSGIIRKIITESSLEKKPVTQVIIHKKDLVSYLEEPPYPIYKLKDRKEIGIVNLLAYTSYGGEYVKAEACTYKGSGNLQITGTIGNKMKESIQIALSYLKANTRVFKIEGKIFENIDIHVHVPYLEKTKDGPSAGIAFTTVLLSTITNLKISNLMAMTGEMTLTGKIIGVGKIIEKVTNGYKNGIHTFILPQENKEEAKKIPKEIQKRIKIYYVNHYEEVYKILKEQSE